MITLLGGLLAAALILYSGYVLYDNYQIENQAFSGAWDVLKYKPQLMEDGVSLSQPATLTEINSDYRAWLTLYGTNVDYPVMQGPDDTYYASHDVYGMSSLTGAIYLSAGNSADLTDSYNLIYGHHMDNSAMFGGLDDYLEPVYYSTHREGIFVTPAGVFNLRAFAVVSTDAYLDDVYETGPGRTVAEISRFLNAPDARSTVHIFDRSALEGAEKIVALSTCADATTNGRLVVFFVATLRNLITVELPSYAGIYDAEEHSVQASVNYPEDTVIEYSLDGGESWSTALPNIRNVGTVEVLVRASNDHYGTASAKGALTVTPAPAVVTAADSCKLYGNIDPHFTASVSGIFDGTQLLYSVDRIGGDEAVGFYPGVIVPSGASLQGNYTVTYIPADFTISTSHALSIAATGYDGIFDNDFHMVTVAVSIPDGTTLSYSIDGGESWSTEIPSIRDVGTVEVLIRAENPNCETVIAKASLRVKPRPVMVVANAAEKTFGAEDPLFTATVTGLLDDYTLVYNITRPGAGRDEAVGLYSRAIIPVGESLQGNYSVTYIPADFIILKDNSPVVTPTEPTEPTAPTEPRGPGGDITPAGTPPFAPKGQGLAVWALVNLICVLLTAYLFLPLLHLRDKYGRIKLMKQVNRLLAKASPSGRFQDDNEDDFRFQVKKFRRRLRLGVILEAVTTVVAIVVFLLTEDIRLPMVLIDRWTPLMLLILLITWIIDLRLARYREDDPQEQQENQN